MANKIIRNEHKENKSKINNFDIKCNYEFGSNEKINLCIDVTVRKIHDFIAYVEKNEINIFPPNDNFFTAFHSLLQSSSYNDFR